MAAPPTSTLLLLLLPLFLLHLSSAQFPIGVNYGTFADNLPPPSQVASFLTRHTSINHIKLYDANPVILRAFAGTNISVTVSVANSDVISLADPASAHLWISTHVTPFYPQTKIKYIAVGNEILATADKNLVAHLLPAMKALLFSLQNLNIFEIKVSTPHSLGILSLSQPPSAGSFRRGYDRVIFTPMLQFHRETNSPFMINPYPYFGCSDQTLDYALFKANDGVRDDHTGKVYTSMFDAQLDAVYSAMERLGFGDVEIVVAETGWPSAGDQDQPYATLENAVSYNENLVRHVNSGAGTPLMPNRTFETFLFSLFNENLKDGSTAEKNFGVFAADLRPVYDVGILRQGEAGAPSTAPTPTSPISPAPSDSQNLWCVPVDDASDDLLQANIDYVCSLGIDCTPIQDGGPCFEPDTVRSHAAFAMNAYYQTYGQDVSNCNFANTGMVVASDPSYATCKYVS